MRCALTDDIRALGSTPLFEQCSERELMRIDRYGTFVTVSRGRVLCRPGQRTKQVVILVAGEAIAVTTSGTKERLVKGDFYGDFLDDDDNNVEQSTLTALTDGLVFAVARHELKALLACSPSLDHRLGSAPGSSQSKGAMGLCIHAPTDTRQTFAGWDRVSVTRVTAGDSQARSRLRARDQSVRTRRRVADRSRSNDA
jgi:CRP-like cAMP-binding protein